MTLSDARQNLVDLIIEGRCVELSRRQNEELIQFCHKLRKQGQWKTALNRMHAKHMHEQGTFIVTTYIEHYEKEGKKLDADDIPIITARIAHRFATETNDRALKVPEFSGLSSEMESLLHDIENSLRQVLIIAMKTTELNDPSIQMPLRDLVEENVRKERRVIARIYLISKGRTSTNIEYDEIAQEERLPKIDVLHICDGLHSKGLIRIIAPELARMTDEGLTVIRNEVLNEKDNSTVRSVDLSPQPDAQPDFSFIVNDEIKTIMERDYAELQKLEPQKTPKSVLVLSGSIIEGLLLDAIAASGQWTFKEASERFLKDMIYPAKQRGIIQHDNLSAVLRIFRNLVHPAREIRDRLTFDESHAKHARAAVEVIISEVRKWHSSRT